MRLIKGLLRRLGAVNELFGRIIIVGCILFMTHVVERCMDITESTGVSTYSIIQYSALFFGGELVMLIAKRISKDICTGKNTADKGRTQDCD
ncbi:MAG: hypothetical protein ACI3VB_05010 [Oscillospiraceae bacterium]